MLFQWIHPQGRNFYQGVEEFQSSMGLLIPYLIHSPTIIFLWFHLPYLVIDHVFVLMMLLLFLYYTNKPQHLPYKVSYGNYLVDILIFTWRQAFSDSVILVKLYLKLSQVGKSTLNFYCWVRNFLNKHPHNKHKLLVSFWFFSGWLQINYHCPLYD